MAMARSAIKASESGITTPDKGEEEDFDEDTLRAIADVYRNQGNEEFKKGDFTNAIHFYTEGIKVNCTEKELRATLYNNRAIAHFKLGNYHDSLSDAKAAIELQPTFLKAIVRGASACVELSQFEEAITWCDKGLAIDQNNKTLVKLKTKSVSERNKEAETREQSIKGTVDAFQLAEELLKLYPQQETGNVSGNLGTSLLSFDDVKKALDYYSLGCKIAKEIGDNSWQGAGDLGNVFQRQGDFKRAIDYHSLDLKIAKEAGDKSAEGKAYGNLGYSYQRLGDFKRATDYHNLHLDIAKEAGDKSGEACAYGNLASAFQSLGDFKRAIDYFNLCLRVAKEVGDKSVEGKAYGSLGHAFERLGDLKKAINYYDLCLKIAKDLNDKYTVGMTYGHLGNVFRGLGDFKRAIEHHNLDLKIAKEVGDKSGEGRAYSGLGSAFQCLGDFQKAIDYYNLHLSIAKEVGDRSGEGKAYRNLGTAFQEVSNFERAIEYINLSLKISKEVGDKAGEGDAYCNLGTAFQELGYIKRAIHYHNICLEICKEIGDKSGEGKAYCNLGYAFSSLCDFKTAIDYHNKYLKTTKEVGNKSGEGKAYCALGSSFQRLGDFKEAIDYYNLGLKFAKEVGDKSLEGKIYGNLGNSFKSLGDFKRAIDYHNLDLKIAKEVGDRLGEGEAYQNLGCDFSGLGDFKTSMDYHNLHLKISKEVGCKSGEGYAYGNLGNVFLKLGDLQKAMDFYSKCLNIAKELEDKTSEAAAYYSLGNISYSLNSLPKAVEQYQASVTLYNVVRNLLKSKDEWKINFRHQFKLAYTGLWRALVKQGKIVEALFAAEKGRAQALIDLMESSFCNGASQPVLHEGDDKDSNLSLRHVPSNTIFQAVDFDHNTLSLWVLLKGEHVQFRQTKLNHSLSLSSVTQPFESLVRNAYSQIGVGSDVTCENRSLEALRGGFKTEEKGSQPSDQHNCLSTLYKIIIQPIADLLEDDDLVIVPDGPLWLVPYAAFMDAESKDRSKYLCESFRIRLIPSLTSLTLIANCPNDFHRKSGALLVGDPWVAEVTNSQGEQILEPLPFAKKEVEMIGKILNATPLTGKKATKVEVLKRLSSVALVHFAAHGHMETGEIALTPSPKRKSKVLKKEDYILTIEDVLNVQLRAKLVVLSCCHSGRGEIKAEGVVGIARAFMGVGARSVLVSLWAIDDEATMEFMSCFYRQLVKGRSASESLNEAMKSLRESDKYSDIKYWAPFVLIGDDVTLDFSGKK